MELPEGYRFGWSYIPHFIHTRFYTYAYVFAQLASLALYARYRERRRRVRRRLPRLPGHRRLGLAGGAAARLGLDITRDDCWDAGFAEIERLIEMAEAW